VQDGLDLFSQPVQTFTFNDSVYVSSKVGVCFSFCLALIVLVVSAGLYGQFSDKGPGVMNVSRDI